jgi:RNA polymerase sigma-70 factor (ECF subfamily)
VHNHLDAEDVAQDTLFKAWEKIDSYEPGTFIGWLMRITYNRAMDFHRFRGRHPQSFDYDEINEDGFRALVDTSEKSAETQFEDNELSSEMAAKLKKISPDFALPIALRYIDDLDYEAIAQKLDVPIGTVRSRIHRGKIALKKLLEE